MAIGGYRKLCATGVVAICAAALSSHSAMAGVVIATAKIDQGLLLINGTSSFGTQVQMDLFDPVPIDPGTRQFSMSVVYVPADCIVDLQITGGVTIQSSAVVANCSPANLIPRGAWDVTKTYFLNDLVVFSGSTYRAINPGPLLNKATPPGGTNWQNYWQLFVSKGANGLAGANGADGAQGPAGADGAVGAQGPVGARGAKGDPGSQGLIGLTGPAGADGAAGPTGADGAAGAKGAKGDVGVQGPIGLTGLTGPAGAVGAVGAQGPIGLTGPAGAQGAQGAKGNQGDVGPIGLTGATGAQGPQGVAGPAGATGATGPQGPVGTGIGGHGIVNAVSASNSSNKSVTVTCGAGKVVLGGGAFLPAGFEGGLAIYASYPSATNAWTVTAAENDAISSNWTVTAYAICATQ